MNPTLAFIAHDPLFAVVGGFKVDLLAIEAIQLFLILLETRRAQVFDVIFECLVMLCMLVKTADSITANVGIVLLDFG